MLILSTTQDKIKTHVKQFIGRGLRLFRDVRIYDEPSNPLLKQQEILHVICEKGSNFDQFISEIRGELGWSKELFEEEYIQEEKHDLTIAKIDQYNEIKLPILTRYSQFIKNELDLINDLTYENLNIDFFVDRNTYIEQNNKYWSFEEKDRLSEEDIVDSIDLKRGQGRITNLPLIIDSKEINRIIAKVISGQNLLPSHPIVKSKLFESISKLNDANIFYKKRNESSRNYYINNLTQNLSEFLVKKLNNYYEGKDIIKHEYMKQIFKDRTVTIKKNFSKDKIINTISNLNVDLNKIDFRNYLIEGFNKSYYNFNWFESSHEYKLAFELDKLSEVEFWIRNKREYYHEYGVGNHYHPDFIVKVGDKLYTIEVKGTGYLDSSITRNQIDMLKKLSSETHGTIFLLDSTVDDKIYWKVKTFQDILNNNDLYKIDEIEEDNQKTLI